MKYHIWTEGCQMNVADSSRVASALEQMGYQNTPAPEEADVIILNTCVVRQSAEDKAAGRLSSLKPVKTRRPDVVINLMGCMVGMGSTDALKKRFPYVDVFSPPSDPRPLLDFLQKERIQQAGQERNAWLDGDLVLPLGERGKQVSAFIPIVYGCSHACAYCIIPYKRGGERSRPPAEIMAEARALVHQGVREITLLGQIVDRYGLDQPGYPHLADLLRALSELDGLERIRFLTSHPNWMTTELMDCVAELPKVMPHIEVPNQAGDDEVLANMKRGYTADQYRQLVAELRRRIPGVSIATDIIVGFPGETDEQFQHTYDLLAELRLDVAHLARYSPREGTYSQRRMPDDVPEEEKWRRFRLLEDLQAGIAAEIHREMMGKTVQVLFEFQRGKRWGGRTPNNDLVFIESDEDLRGQTLPVKIHWTGPWSMLGERV